MRRKFDFFLDVFVRPQICLQFSKLTFNSRKTLEFKRVRRMILNRGVAEPTNRLRIPVPYSKFGLKKYDGHDEKKSLNKKNIHFEKKKNCKR